MKRKEYEKYIRNIVRTQEMPGFTSYPRYLFASSSALRYHFERIYQLENGKLVLDEDWKPRKPSLLRWIKNLIL